MSGEYFEGKDEVLFSEVFPYIPVGYGIEERDIERELAIKDNVTDDAYITELLYDMMCLVSSVNYYKSGDISKDRYTKDLEYIKSKYKKV